MNRYSDATILTSHLRSYARLPLSGSGELEHWKQIFWDQKRHFAGFLSTIRDPAKTSPDSIFYVEGCWRCFFSFSVEASQQVLQDDWLSLKIQVCPASLLRWLRQDLSPLTSSATLSNAKTWLPFKHPHLHAMIMFDRVDDFRGLLGHDPFGLLGSPSLGPRALINPLWAVRGCVERFG